VTRRYALSDAHWEHIKDLLPGQAGQPGARARDNRLFVDAVLCRYRAGIPWRDLPERFGDFRVMHTRHSRWSGRGVWQRVLEFLAQDADNPTGFHLTTGQSHDLEGADVLLKDTPGQIVIADKAYDAQTRVVQPLLDKGKEVVIASRSTRKQLREHDRRLYKERHLVENFFARLKQYRAIATRCDKTARNFLGAIHLVASMVWLV
jgi:transposase